MKKFIFFIMICVNLCACVTQKMNYSSFLYPESILIEDDKISGWLKKDIIIKTPYGKMKVAAVGGKSGYLFDFCYYENGNPHMIWLRNEQIILYDTMLIRLQAFTPNRLSNIVFHDNFNIQTCDAVNEVTYLGEKLPPKTTLHFNKNGILVSFTIFQDWMFDDVMYYEGQYFRIIKKNIIPDYENIAPKGFFDGLYDD